MQIRTLIRLIKGGFIFDRLKLHTDVQVMLKMNYSSPVSNALCDKLLHLAEKYESKEVEFEDNSCMPNDSSWSFKVNGRRYRSKISSWSKKLDAKTNAVIYIYKS